MKNKIALYFLVFPLLLVAQENIDLFIWAGQSNAQGYTGDAAEYPKEGQELDEFILLNGNVHGNKSSKGEWVNMQPQEGRYPAGHFGPEVSFSRKLKKAGYNPAIFKYTFGGTGLAKHWKAPNKGGLYDSMVQNLTAATQKLTNMGYRINIRGFIWIQGESDGINDEAASAYQENLIIMINHLRNKVLDEPNLNIILGVDEQHYFVEERPIIVEAQKRIAQVDKNIIFTTMYGLPKTDKTHLTPVGLIEHGHRIYQAFKILLDTNQMSSLETLKQ